MSADREFYEQQHYDLFGHWPLMGLDGDPRCVHPMHDKIQRMIDAPGVDLELPFHPNEVIDDDSDLAVLSRQRYQEAVSRIRSELRAMDEEDAYKGRTLF